MSNFNKNKTSNKKKIPDPKIHSLPQKNAVLYDMTLQTLHKQYHNSVRKYLRLYTDVSSTTNGKSNLFHVKKLSHKIFHVVSLAYGQNANCTFLFSIRICWFCWYCSNVRKANISLLPQEKFLISYFSYRNTIPSSSPILSHPKRISSVHDKCDIYISLPETDIYLLQERVLEAQIFIIPKNNCRKTLKTTQFYYQKN